MNADKLEAGLDRALRRALQSKGSSAESLGFKGTSLGANPVGGNSAQSASTPTGTTSSTGGLSGIGSMASGIGSIAQGIGALAAL